MKELKYIFHAFLLLLAGISVFICLKTFYSTQKQIPGIVLTDQQRVESNAFSRGKQLFQLKCAACHILFSHSTGPSLCGFESRGPWSERENVYQWIKNPTEFMKKDQYARELKEAFGGVMMTAFPELTNAEIDEIIDYINNACGTTMTRN